MNLVLSMGGQSFNVVRLKRAEDRPGASERVIDVALLDMNHHFPNLGHDSVVQTIACIAGMCAPVLEPAGMSIRVISYPVRNLLLVPDADDAHFPLVVGTGGPGHIDPYQNDGVASFSQGVKEDVSWEPRFQALLERIRADEKRALIAICHSFGLVCRWAQVAKPTLRGPEKGGKSAGVHENVLTQQALAHPWFSRLASELADGKHLRIADSRLFDLIPFDTLPDWVTPLGYESKKDGTPGDALTMIELARDRAGVMPRMLGVNHHPEIYDLELQRELMAQKLARGEVTQQWYDERHDTIGELLNPEATKHLILTSRYTLICPLAFYIFRAVRERREAMGLPAGLHEDQVMAREFVAERRRVARGPDIDGYAV